MYPALNVKDDYYKFLLLTCSYSKPVILTETLQNENRICFINTILF